MSEDGREAMKDAVRALLPFLEAERGSLSESRVEAASLEQLRRFYLFAIDELVVSNEETDIHRYVEERFQSALAAAHGAGWSVLTAVTGSKAGVRIAIGFMATTAEDQDPKVFERILGGLMPGLRTQLIDTGQVEALFEDKYFGGIVAGVPILKIDDERQRFNLPSVIRSLYGEDYFLLIVSRPVAPNILQQQLRKVWEVRDLCHERARQSRARTHTEGSNWHTSDSRTEGSSISITAGSSIGMVFTLVNASVSVSETYTASTGISSTRGEGGDKHWSESLSQEQQDSVALEMERLAERYADRLLKAVNVGEWEIAISFGTRTEAGRSILAGSLLGELAKPSTDVFPPRVHFEPLDKQRPLLLPAADSLSGIFPRSFASYLTGEELAAIAAPPVEQLPGYDIRRAPSLGLTVRNPKPRATGARVLGAVCDHGRALEGVDVEIDSSDLAKHLFVCGLTGTGKTTTVREILAKCEVPFLVLESAKRDYRQLLGMEAFCDNLKVYTVGDGAVSPLGMNPFYVMPGISPVVHIDFLKAIFNASFALYGPMPYILEKCVHNVYLRRGWNLTKGFHPRLCNTDGEIDHERYHAPEAEHFFPTLADLKDEVQRYVKDELEYRGEISDNIRTAIVTRLESLCVGAKGLLFGTSKRLDIEALLNHPTILELEALSDDDDKAFFLGIMLTFISEYRQYHNPASYPFRPRKDNLQHLLVIEEAHRLLKNVMQQGQTEQLGNPRGKAVEFFANVLSEMRSMGQGVAVVEQIPSKLLPDVIKNTNAKIIHRLVAGDDQALVSSSLGLQPEEAIYLTSLKTGHVLYLKEGMQRPVEVEVHRTVPSTRIDDDRIRSEMQYNADKANKEADAASATEIRTILTAAPDELAIKVLCSISAGKDATEGRIVAQALDTIKAELMRKGRCYLQPAIKEYLASQLVGLLVRGTFRVADANVNGLANDIEAVVSAEPNSAQRLLSRLGLGWGAGNARDGLVDRLSELVVSRTCTCTSRGQDDKFTIDRSAIDERTREYFMSDGTDDLREDVVDEVVKRLDRGVYLSCR